MLLILPHRPECDACNAPSGSSLVAFEPDELAHLHDIQHAGEQIEQTAPSREGPTERAEEVRKPPVPLKQRRQQHKKGVEKVRRYRLTQEMHQERSIAESLEQRQRR